MNEVQINESVLNLDFTAILAFAPLALITLIEDLGHMMILGNITRTDIIQDPGFDKVVLGNGLATGVASLFGGVPLTTYAENIGVLAITKVYSSFNLWIAAICAIILSAFNRYSGLPGCRIYGRMKTVKLYGLLRF